ncbi:hypothetical protein COCC4DRAFT_69926 [Bipolaris maydis ATCC 48331]|uniref:Protein kinase domain-containing protein n=2 Tax=Cochliobolus heterostrophus TaxID=5016 RepID=M2UFV4_COCH5|nr:uncharacterized protein COCC4DRAFT_69926 [Bipolaris maydis ATCC 48331]EMD92606.1 hypothetical protein COCHEDRAFT_1224393 [Bipolaris maydis C5]KAJ5022414.1 kinase-like domain-containing protein [Bipolaris maydis]ENI08302.1 hypothetical protein COCC4DRAFT_69926 [Bipolaris maydis ATCC 48331]KAJ6210379.1 kinase-like domain-containing protein [Bipolaris maydis]KAJ6272089.1 kinase-like domain-containing protein [Bipolaris maydis]
MSNFDMTDNAGPCDPTSDPSTLGQPIEVASREAIPFRHVRNIGQGGSAVIEMVSHTFTNQIFALKTFRRYNRRQFESVKRVFINEISIMRRLSSHPHIIQLRGSYICDRELGILLSPVAGGGDLAAYITRALESGMPSEQEITLNRAFGCLAGGLAFIHKHTIRHKDIKPQNILVHEGRVLYTDFGISFDADQQDTTTVGCPGLFTQRYCAPEVQDWANRNRKSDVYSLGCVYLEILDALEPEVGFRQMDDRPYFAKLKQVRRLLSQASVTGGVRKGLFSVCHDMLDPDQVKRLDTNNVVCRMTKLSNPPYHSDTRLYCNDCLRKVECNNPECNDEDKSKDKETWKEKEGDFAAKSVDAGLTVDGRYSDKEMYSDAGVSSDKGTPLDTGSQEISIDVVNNGKKKKRVTKKSKIWDSGENAGPWHGAKKFPKVSTNNSRFYCTICGELGHTTSKYAGHAMKSATMPKTARTSAMHVAT